MENTFNCPHEEEMNQIYLPISLPTLCFTSTDNVHHLCQWFPAWSPLNTDGELGEEIFLMFSENRGKLTICPMQAE